MILQHMVSHEPFSGKHTSHGPKKFENHCTSSTRYTFRLQLVLMWVNHETWKM